MMDPPTLRRFVVCIVDTSIIIFKYNLSSKSVKPTTAAERPKSCRVCGKRLEATSAVELQQHSDALALDVLHRPIESVAALEAAGRAAR